jgi:uroporphyrinogen-III synthase
MPALSGIGVLVTRPEQQAMPLCRLLENQGAIALRLPAVDIKPLQRGRALAARLGALENFELIIFNSVNAVRFGAALLDQKRDLCLAGMGPATAHALNQAGYRVAVQPVGGFDSEHLLAHPMLEHVAGQRILLIKGSRGRELLEQELQRRGAQVITAEVYERVPSAPSASVLEALEEQFTAGAVHVITATSVEIALNLLDLATPLLREEFARVHWLVPSARVADALGGREFRAPVLTAASAENQDLVAELVRWRSTESGA